MSTHPQRSAAHGVQHRARGHARADLGRDRHRERHHGVVHAHRVDEREGGTVLMHMGDDDSPGTITGWDPPHRFAYFEPDWATLTGNDPASVTELATEFLVEAKSGGTCVLHVVTSAFGTGADWEQEFFDDMEKGWRPYFENLRLYLSNFPGQQVTSLTAHTTIERPRDEVWQRCAATRRRSGRTIGCGPRHRRHRRADRDPTRDE